MAAQPIMTTDAPGVVRHSSDPHTRPLDTVLVALSEAHCGTCQALLRILKAHLETTVPAWPEGGAQ